MKCKQCNNARALARKYSPVFKETYVNIECATHESYLKLISWVALYNICIAEYRNLLVEYFYHIRML